MTRVLSIVVTLLAFCAVFAASAAYAVPIGATASLVAVDESTCAEPPPAAQLTGKFCVKRHTLGLPCTPSPLILPVAFVLAGSSVGLSPLPPDVLVRIDPHWARHFRPPRTVAA